MNSYRIQETKIKGITHPLGYRVTTIDQKSLGLRNNANIYTYFLNEWKFVPLTEVKKGICDKGGIWVARTRGHANAYRKYMLNKYDTETRIFTAALGRILHVTDCRIKTDGICLLEELL